MLCNDLFVCLERSCPGIIQVVIAWYDIDVGSRFFHAFQLLCQLLVAAAFPVVRQISAENQESRLFLLRVIDERFHQFIAVGQDFSIPAVHIGLEGISSILKILIEVMGIRSHPEGHRSCFISCGYYG
ncbi:hypothetical protein D3C75_989010 [compost metagenome]